MTFKQWVRDVFGPESRAARASRRGKSRRPSKRGYMPYVELLEDRTLLSGSPGAVISISGIGFAAEGTTTPADSVPRIQVDQARQDVNSGQALLVCAYSSQYAYQQNNLQGSISLQEFQALATSLSKNQEIIFYCGCVQDAGAVNATETYQGEGFTNVKALNGGIIAWREAGYPVADPSYAAGSSIPIVGIGFAAGETVDLQVTHIDGTVNTPATEPHWTTVADATGAISTSWVVNDPQVAGSHFELTVTGETSHQAAFATFSGAQASATATATVSTDRKDYAPGTPAVISGSGFVAGETVTLQVVHIDGTANTDASHTPWTVVADAAGDFPDDLGRRFGGCRRFHAGGDGRRAVLADHGRCDFYRFDISTRPAPILGLRT